MTIDGVRIAATVNGKPVEAVIEPRLLLVDFLRHELRLTGTHVGCAHGVCGACTILVDGRPARSCLMFAAQADGAVLTTVESLAERDQLSPLQDAFRRHHALQCGYCTSGILMIMASFLEETRRPDEAAIRTALSGNLCRCTGYANIVSAVLGATAAPGDETTPDGGAP
jgi:aerobic-type carbon monoxide dehydrogenase small subunit (CoxS/CutS family)